MKNLKDHTPKADSWEKILQQGQFENQLANHLDRLPQFFPNERTWERITSEMDRKKAIPIWMKWGIAASILGFLIAGGVSLSKMESKLENQITQVLPNQNSNATKANESQNAITIEPTQDSSPIELSNILSTEEIGTKRRTKRTIEAIKVPKIDLSELIELNSSENLSLSIPEPQRTEPNQPKTLHQVNISWSKIKPGLQVTTPFGRKEIDPTTKTQAATIPPSQITIEINN